MDGKAHFIDDYCGESLPNSKIGREWNEMGSDYKTWAVSNGRRVLFSRRQRKEIAKTISTKNLKTCADIEFHNMSAYSVCTDWTQASTSAPITVHIFFFFFFFVRIRCRLSAHQPIWLNRLFYYYFFFIFGQRIDANKNKRNYTHQQVVLLVFVWRRTKLKKIECSFGLTCAITSCSMRQLPMSGFTLV